MKPDQGAWQPIETAPKDGRDVLVCYAVRDGQRVVCGRWLRWQKRWITDIGFVPATHWMPLPAPPPDEASL
jgi:hypothetical protein